MGVGGPNSCLGEEEQFWWLDKSSGNGGRMDKGFWWASSGLSPKTPGVKGVRIKFCESGLVE